MSEPGQIDLEFHETDISATPGDAGFPVLVDPHAVTGSIPLDRFFETQKFSPWLMAMLMAFGLFLLFNVIGAFTAIILLMVDMGPDLDPQDLMTSLENAIGPQLWANTVGQFLGIGIPVLLIARLHSSKAGEFLRIRKTDPKNLIWAALGLAAIWPTVVFLVWVNSFIPVPQFLAELDEMRTAFIEKVLAQEPNMFFNLIALAVTPALCEEFMFRGYLQRQMERSLSIPFAIIATGVVFGAYHMSITQLLPLSFLGVYLCWLTWATGSIWPAVLVHFLNNGISVVVAGYLSAQPDFSMEQLDELPFPWYGSLALAILGLTAFYAIQKRLTKGITESSGSLQNERVTI